MMQLTIVGNDKGAIWLVKQRYSIGKSRNCDLTLPDATLQDVHADLQVDGDALTLTAAAGSEITVNGERQTGQCSLKHGDTIGLGQSELRVLDPKVERAAFGADTQPRDAWALQGLSTALSEKRYPISQVQVVGRAADCDITLGVAHLSRQHARLLLNADGLQVEDLGSVNGTFVNGRRVDKMALKNGDELRFDTLRFRVIGPDTGSVDTDLDKTSLRPAMARPVQPQKPRHQPERERQGAAARKPRKPVGAKLSNRPVAQPSSPAAAEPTSRNWIWMLAGLLVLALAALWFLWPVS